MANTYVQAYFHIVFAVKHRQALIQRTWKDELEKYITKIVQRNGHKLIAIGSMPDHLHIFLGYKLTQTIPKLVEEIKTSSNHWIRERKLSKVKFDWQKGYGAFTHSHSQIAVVSNYILNQEKHHGNKSFQEEYLEMLSKFEIEFKEEYIFEFFESSNEWQK